MKTLKIHYDPEFTKTNKVSSLCEPQLDHAMLNPQHPDKHVLKNGVALDRLHPPALGTQISYFRHKYQCVFILGLIERNRKINDVIACAMKRREGDCRILFHINVALTLPELKGPMFLFAGYDQFADFDPLANKYQWQSMQCITVILDFPATLQNDEQYNCTLQTIFPWNCTDATFSDPASPKFFIGEISSRVYTETFTYFAATTSSPERLERDWVANEAKNNIFKNSRLSPVLPLSRPVLDLPQPITLALKNDASKITVLDQEIEGLNNIIALDAQQLNAARHNLSKVMGRPFDLINPAWSPEYKEFWGDKIQSQFSLFVTDESLLSTCTPENRLLALKAAVAALNKLRSTINNLRDVTVQRTFPESSEDEIIGFAQCVITHFSNAAPAQLVEFKGMNFFLDGTGLTPKKIKQLRGHVSDFGDGHLLKIKLGEYLVDAHLREQIKKINEAGDKIVLVRDLYEGLQAHVDTLNQREQQRNDLRTLFARIRPNLVWEPAIHKTALSGFMEYDGCNMRLQANRLLEYIETHYDSYKITDLLDEHFDTLNRQTRENIVFNLVPFIEILVSPLGMDLVESINVADYPLFFETSGGIVQIADSVFRLPEEYAAFCGIVDQIERLITRINKNAVDLRHETQFQDLFKKISALASAIESFKTRRRDYPYAFSISLKNNTAVMLDLMVQNLMHRFETEREFRGLLDSPVSVAELGTPLSDRKGYGDVRAKEIRERCEKSTKIKNSFFYSPDSVAVMEYRSQSYIPLDLMLESLTKFLAPGNEATEEIFYSIASTL